MEKEQYFEDYVVGEARQSLGRTITETDIVLHAGHSGDFYPHHMDAEFCAGQPFKRPIAHGTMTFAIGIGLTATQINPRAFTYGYERLRFPNPVHAGDTIRTTVTVGSKSDDLKRPTYGRVVEATETKNQDGKTVMYCEHVLLVERKRRRKTFDELRQTWPAPANPLPVMIIGAGGIVRDAHLPAYAKAGIQVCGVTDLDPTRSESLASNWSIPEIHSDVASAASSCGTDVVYDIAVPPAAITDVLPNLPDGAAVLIQKPMGEDQAQARKILSICQEKNLKAAVNFQLRFAPMMMAAKSMIEAGRIGDLLEIEVHLNVYTPWDLFPFLIPMERVEIAVHSIHYLDTIRAFAGNPVGVFARSIPDPRVPEFAQTRTTAVLDYDDARRVVLSINHNHRGGRKFQSAWFRIEGTAGTMMVKLGVIFDYPNGEPDELWYCPSNGDWEQIPLEGSWFIDAFMGSMRNVQRFNSGEDTSLYTSVEDAYETMALAEACFESMREPALPLDLSRPKAPHRAKKAWSKDGVELPHGTRLRMSYNRKGYCGEVDNGEWLVNGKPFIDPSPAAKEVARTKTGEPAHVSGWKYWEARRPSDNNWIKIDDLREEARNAAKR